ncbi:MAG: peptide-methionine (R)-S-oxide reductase MsrB [Thermoanaerobaculia bacterium]|nr:peptide-methionine (R)-S-oxide reductase MsrB [Thermoanaerobaculia bacterium]
MANDKRKSRKEWREVLSPERYAVCVEGATERAFTGRYNDCKTAGIYVCGCCGEPLFDSATKYESGSGWPSFYQPITDEAVATRTDGSHGMLRTEVLCAACDAHLGHVFPDGPHPTGLRYCMNSVALDLDPSPDDEENGGD